MPWRAGARSSSVADRTGRAADGAERFPVPSGSVPCRSELTAFAGDPSMTDPTRRPDDDSWTHGGGRGFGVCEDSDEQLHPEHRVAHDSLTETWAYMFWMPRQRIGSIIYLWVHPNLGVVTGGLTVY